MAFKNYSDFDFKGIVLTFTLLPLISWYTFLGLPEEVPDFVVIFFF